MRLGRRSTNVQDRRGMGPVVAGGGIGAVVIALIAMFFGVDPGVLTQGGETGAPASAPSPDDPLAVHVSQVLADTEDTWNELFRAQGAEYREPVLVLFDGVVQSACGMAGSAVGPFYCPLDEQVYLDLSFFRELDERFGAPGDFAQAYVIAHEVGHHVQTLTGTSERVQRARQAASPEVANELSVRQELQADCYAGVWAHHGQRRRNILEAGDVGEGLQAAAAIGDDRLQRQTQGYVVPESFTHGSSAQRVQWFRAGFESGDASRCDTFARS